MLTPWTIWRKKNNNLKIVKPNLIFWALFLLANCIENDRAWLKYFRNVQLAFFYIYIHKSGLIPCNLHLLKPLISKRKLNSQKMGTHATLCQAVPKICDHDITKWWIAEISTNKNLFFLASLTVAPKISKAPFLLRQTWRFLRFTITTHQKHQATPIPFISSRLNVTSSQVASLHLSS